MRFVDPDKIKRGASNVMSMIVERTKESLTRGDSSGHDFHGNQYKEGSGGGESKGPTDAQRAEVNGHVEKAADAHFAKVQMKNKFGNAAKQKSGEAHFHAVNGIKAADKYNMPRTAAALRAYESTSHGAHLMDASGRSSLGNPHP